MCLKALLVRFLVQTGILFDLIKCLLLERGFDPMQDVENAMLVGSEQLSEREATLKMFLTSKAGSGPSYSAPHPAAGPEDGRHLSGTALQGICQDNLRGT
jgi:hypothetical protein